jgi:hypothetical protein
MLKSICSRSFSWNRWLQLHRLSCYGDLLCLYRQLTECRLALPLRTKLLVFYGHLFRDLHHLRWCLLVRAIRRVHRCNLIIIIGLFLPEVFCDLCAGMRGCLLEVGGQRNLIQSIGKSRLIQNRLRYPQNIWYLLIGRDLI